MKQVEERFKSKNKRVNLLGLVKDVRLKPLFISSRGPGRTFNLRMYK